MSKWLHYSDSEIKEFDRARVYQPTGLEGTAFYKPKGFWITDDSDSCWKSWCVAEEFRLHALTHKHEVELDDEHVLIVKGVGEFEKFKTEFGHLIPCYAGGDTFNSIDWMKVYGRYAGLIITPYLWQFRLDMDCHWYYSWDCASGCIWDLSAIKDVRLIEVADVGTIKAREAA